MTTVTPVEPAAAQETSSYVDWPAILAGGVVAAAISLVLLAFGSAVGLSLTDPFGREGVSLFWIAVAMALWVVWVQVSSLMIGGYLTGRMRKRNYDATEEESDIRDGFHGLLVWATAVVITAILALGGLGTLVNSVGAAAGGIAQGAGAAAGGAITEAAEDAPFQSSIDRLLRTPTTEGDAAATRDEVGRILVEGVTGEGISEDDRAYLAQLVAARTDMSQEEAQARVDEVIAQAQAIQDDIVAAAEQARRVAILGAFLTAASLAVGAAGAWFAAVAGGNHRDTHTVTAFFARRRPPVV
ncbi:hypothetical protein NO932_01370 [Pelagibacterium sp. 26DY04]|uniref:hypothetical protein n=1 Tax=Pelagibacterium sp. 26DY04 TaxID=2967130 RepID=UPI0028159379|nr:hypothetical protein [Pelagibacterium sp. 26DY04]WMT87279.1 hypothetical protein NO932_01370 [Pelagibacterium sp. 26DY04]